MHYNKYGFIFTVLLLLYIVQKRSPQPQDRETLSSQQQSPSSIATSTCTAAQYQPVSPATEKKTKFGKYS